MTTPQQHHLIGQIIADRYRVEGLLGTGGMGAVYIAEHLTLRKQVALKVVHPQHSGNAEMAARFAQEAMVTSRIDHPNVISAMDYGTLEDGTAYLAVQLVRGPSLTKVLTAGPRMPWMRAVEIGAQIADALAAAHAHGIVHRDLKPENVLLQPLDDGGDLVKILDFGVAKVARSGQDVDPAAAEPEITKLGLIIGTPGYMAPEQAVGSAADHRADLYALGVILWECVTGRPLWQGPDVQTVLERQLTLVPPLLSDIVPDSPMPEALPQLVAKLLGRRADERPSDANDVRDQLREILALSDADTPRWRSGARLLRTPSGMRQLAAPPTPAAGLPVAPAEAPPSPSMAPPRRGRSLLPRRGRSARPAWLLTLLVTTILGGAVFMVATGQLEVRPQGSAAQMADRVAKELNLPTFSAPASPIPPQAKRKDALPPALSPVFEQLMGSEARSDRVTAANTILTHTPIDEVPNYVRRIAYLQLASTCAAKKSEIDEMAMLRDPRVLPTLIELSQRPRSGCGKRKRDDCLACLREPLEALIESLKQL